MNHQVVHQRHAASVAAPSINSPPSGDASKTLRRTRVKQTHPRWSSIISSSKTRATIRFVVSALAAATALFGVIFLVVKLVSSHGVSSTTNYMFHHPTKLAYPKSVSDMLDDKHHMPFNQLYHSPDSMTIVGDRTDRYAKIRKVIDAVLPNNNPQRSLQRVQELVTHSFTPMTMLDHNSDQVHPEEAAMQYDIYNCPKEPPLNYPYAWNMLQLLNHWPPDDTTPRPHIYQGLCVFDYERDYDTAMTYRAAELPFVVINDPQVHRAVERWNQPGYMEELMGQEPHRCEFSENNHFMYYVPVSKARRKTKQVPENWKEPTKLLRIPYHEWLKHANVTDDKLGPDNPHWYYRLIGCGLMGNDGSCDRGASEYLYDELPFFQPKESLYIVEPQEQKGIHCRFGMKGVIAENHFDGSRNSIVVLGGSRRYILSHPNECENLHLYKKGHPSARHSAVDWSNPDLEQFPLFKQAKGNEVVLQAGQVLYLPTNWFHYIVSLELNFQCNTRSGISSHYMPPIRQCGF